MYISRGLGRPAPGAACHDGRVSESESVARRVVVHGAVQGVFFRDTTRRRAASRGVTGWVRNRSDGAVEALFEGAADAVDSMVAFVHDGPRGAHVERVDVEDAAPEGLGAFEIR
jgi:acylphosphatase